MTNVVALRDEVEQQRVQVCLSVARQSRNLADRFRGMGDDYAARLAETAAVAAEMNDVPLLEAIVTVLDRHSRC
jgi:hypothetical protein